MAISKVCRTAGQERHPLTPQVLHFSQVPHNVSKETSIQLHANRSSSQRPRQEADSNGGRRWGGEAIVLRKHLGGVCRFTDLLHISKIIALQLLQIPQEKVPEKDRVQQFLKRRRVHIYTLYAVHWPGLQWRSHSLPYKIMALAQFKASWKLMQISSIDGCKCNAFTSK